MDSKKYSEFTNSELNLKLKSLELEYNRLKILVQDMIYSMKELDDEYNKIKEEIRNRKQ
jgi:hypothetical protein